MNRILPVFLLICLVSAKVKAQNPLPDFSVVEFSKDKVRIAWANPFNEALIQLNVQVSMDSLRFYKTIFSTESPQLPQNGFVYTIPFNANFYYRIFYVLNGNAFYFTPAKHAVPDTAARMLYSENADNQNNNPSVVRMITVRTQDSLYAIMDYPYYKRFKDSILMKTKDTLFVLGKNEVMLRPYDPYNIWRPSIYVVTNKDGFVQVKLPEAGTKKYRLVFFDADGKRLFTINHIPETDLVIDKSNFVHAGWFRFELYEDDKLKERNKILLQRDF